MLRSEWPLASTSSSSLTASLLDLSLVSRLVPRLSLHRGNVLMVSGVYCAEIFNNRTRAYGLMTASASQWLWNLILTRFTPNLIQALKEGGVVSPFTALEKPLRIPI